MYTHKWLVKCEPSFSFACFFTYTWMTLVEGLSLQAIVCPGTKAQKEIHGLNRSRIENILFLKDMDLIPPCCS